MQQNKNLHGSVLENAARGEEDIMVLHGGDRSYGSDWSPLITKLFAGKVSCKSSDSLSLKALHRVELGVQPFVCTMPQIHKNVAVSHKHQA